MTNPSLENEEMLNGEFYLVLHTFVKVWRTHHHVTGNQHLVPGI
jgi:hypothetical protein